MDSNRRNKSSFSAAESAPVFIASLDKETIIDGTLFYDRKAKKYSVLVDGQDERIKPGGKNR